MSELRHDISSTRTASRSAALRRPTVLVASLSVAVTGLLAAPAQASDVGWAQVDAVEQVMLPESRFEVTGRLGDKRVRQVHLEATTAGTTRTVGRTTSLGDGSFIFTDVQLPASAELKAVTPRQTITLPTTDAARERHRDAVQKLGERRARLQKVRALRAKGRSSQAILRSVRELVENGRARVEATRAALNRQVTIRRAESKNVTVTVVRGQGSKAAFMPAVAQPGPLAQAPAQDSLVSAGFTPARPGRATTLQRLQQGTWVDVATGAQDRSGHSLFDVTDQGTYRVTTEATDEASAVTTTPVQTRDMKVVFSDEFNEAALDPAKWGVQYRALGTGFRSCAITDETSHRVGGGVLRLGVSKDPARLRERCAYTDDDGQQHQLPFMRNTQLSTHNLFDFKYGFAAARIKVQSAVGMHSAFWSTPNNRQVPGNSYFGSEIDVMEYFGDLRRENGVATFTHTLQADNSLLKRGDVFDSTTLMKGTHRFSEQFHVFSWEWTPQEMIFRLDGREYYRTSEDVPQVPQALALSNLTSSYELVDLVDFNDAPEVDWVRVWQ